MELVAHSDNLPDVESVPLLPALRRQRIAEFLHHHGAVTLQQLAEALHVSLSTLRRDLDALAEEGVVERTHGGAILRHLQYSTFEPNIAAARDLSPREKRLVGAAAAESLVPGQSVIFDSGSTVLEAARAVVARKIPIVAVTNDIEIAQVLNGSPLVQVHLFGGQLRPGMLMNVDLSLPPQKMTLIPAQSVEYAGEQRFVYRLEADGRVKRVPVELGDTHGEAVWVLKGLNVGDRIAVEGLVNLRDGAQVRDLGEVKG